MTTLPHSLTIPEILAFRRKTIDVDAYEFPQPRLASPSPVPRPSSLHSPRMWDDLRQCHYEARIRMEKRHRCLRFSQMAQTAVREMLRLSTAACPPKPRCSHEANGGILFFGGDVRK